MYRTTLLITLIAYIFYPTLVKSQCGITPVLEIDIGPMYKLTMTSANSVLNPNCIIYQREWVCNGNYAGNMVQEDLPADRGFNEITFKAWVLDTLTNDSCYTEYTNIYISTGNKPYVGIHANVSGLNISSSPQFWAEVQAWGTYYFSWGDTTIITSLPFASHSYAAAGYYLFCVTVDDGLNFAYQSCINVNALNGLPTIENQYGFSTIGGAGVGCSTIVEHNFNSIPFLTRVTYEYDFIPGSLTTITPPSSTIVRDTLRIPGRLMLLYSYGDPNSLSGVEPLWYSPVLVDPCDIVPDTIRGFCWNDDDGDAIIDSTEGPAIGVNVKLGSYSATSDSLGNYEILMPLSQVTLSVVQNTSIPASKKYIINPNSSKLHLNYNFGIVNFNARFRGKAFLDLNNDTLFGSGDKIISGALIKAKNIITGNVYGNTSNSSGNFDISVPNGDYRLSCHYSQLDSLSVYPDSIVITSAAGTYNGNDFAFSSSANGVNLCNRMITSSQPRPGFQFGIHCRITNRGLDTASSALVMNYDPTLIALSASPPSGIIDSINNTVTWNVGPINFGSLLNYSLICSIPSTLPLGLSIQNSSVLTVNSPATDYYLLNNNSIINQLLIGSFDPNDKLVNPDQIDLTPGVQNPDEFLYHINFQNTGTASAINVIVQDEIDTNLDINSFNMIGASHNYAVSIVDRTVTWRFLNINLPDSNTNEPGSHGWIEYTIEPTPNLLPSTSIENTAFIYFDFNEPVITNTVSTDYVISTGIHETIVNNDLMIYPNPANTIVNIRSSRSMKKVSVYNALGGLIEENEVLNGSKLLGLNIEDYSSGIYFITVYLGDEVVQRKLIK